MGEQKIADCDGDTIAVAVHPDDEWFTAVTIQSHLDEELEFRRVLLDDAQRLTLARALAPDAFAVVDAVVHWNEGDWSLSSSQHLFEALEAYQAATTPASEGAGE